MKPSFVTKLSIRLAKLWVRNISGLENIPDNGKFIIAANHSSFLDDFLMPGIAILKIKKLVHMYCNDRFYKNKIFAAYLNSSQCIPISIQTKNKDTNKKAFETALNHLKNNEPIGIFPEGGRSKNGELKEARTGIAKLALTAKVPILPIGLAGSYDVFPRNVKFPKFKRCEIKIGKPIYLDKYYEESDNQKVLKDITTKIMKEIAKLTGQEYNY
jgi:1-acyl-sn-glycerol-3-phosphate acyltransferase